MRIRAGDVSEVGRNTKGVIAMELEPEDRVASVDVVPAEAGDGADS
jgi:DNA gyrase subunit A